MPHADQRVRRGRQAIRIYAIPLAQGTVGLDCTVSRTVLERHFFQTDARFETFMQVQDETGEDRVSLESCR